MSNDKQRVYYVAICGRSVRYSYCGRNAKRDASRHAKRIEGRVVRTTGAGWARMCGTGYALSGETRELIKNGGWKSDGPVGYRGISRC